MGSYGPLEHDLEILRSHSLAGMFYLMNDYTNYRAFFLKCVRDLHCDVDHSLASALYGESYSPGKPCGEFPALSSLGEGIYDPVGPIEYANVLPKMPVPISYAILLFFTEALLEILRGDLTKLHMSSQLINGIIFSLLTVVYLNRDVGAMLVLFFKPVFLIFLAFKLNIVSWSRFKPNANKKKQN